MQHDPLTVGVIAAVMTVGNTLLLGLPPSPALLVAAGAGAALVYWADRVLGFSPEDEHAHPDRVVWVRQYRRWLYVEGTALAVTLTAALPLLTAHTLGVAALCGGLGIVHVLPVLPGRRRMKAIGRGRTPTIALAWSVGSVLLPWVEAGAAASVGVASVGVASGAVASGVIVPGVVAPGVIAPGIAVGGVLLAQTLIVYANVVVAGWADRHGDAQAGVPVDGNRSGVEVRRHAVGAAGIAGGLVLVVGAAVLPLTLALSYVAGAFGLAVLLAWLRPHDHSHQMLWLDLAVALPGALVLLMDMGLRI